MLLNFILGNIDALKLDIKTTPNLKMPNKKRLFNQLRSPTLGKESS